MNKKCSKRKLCNDENCKKCFEKSFVSFDEEKVKCWNYKLNNNIKPRNIFNGTSKKYWFTCNKCKHDFISGIDKITYKKRPKWCPYCSKPCTKLCNKKDCNFCFNNSFASFDIKKVECWNYKLNKNKIPRNIFKGTSKKYWFTCDKCKHNFKSNIESITNKQKLTWCPYCSNKKICDKKNCEKCFKKSFASFNINKVKCWNYKLNNNIKPRNIFKNSNKKYWFTCNKCKHNFNSTIGHITSIKLTWCPYCSIPCKKLCNNNCNLCFKKSFASFDNKKVKCWNYKLNNINPRNILKNDNKKYWFTCNKCEHNFNSQICNITSKNSQWCPYCSVPCKKLCDNQDCNFCFNNSFLSFDKEKVKCWNYKLNNNINPRNIFKNSSKKYWFTCNKCNHNFKSRIADVSSKFLQWCPICKNKGEKKLYNYLLTLFPNVKKEFKAKWCKNLKTKRYLPFDFYIKKINLIIELDGDQHFKQVSNWKCPVKTMENDVYKTKMANDNNISVIRLLQTDVLYDKNNWKKHLIHNILLQELRIKTKNIKILNKFISNNNEYEFHINNF